jgi:hypothetical protein
VSSIYLRSVSRAVDGFLEPASQNAARDATLAVTLVTPHATVRCLSRDLAPCCSEWTRGFDSIPGSATRGEAQSVSGDGCRTIDNALKNATTQTCGGRERKAALYPIMSACRDASYGAKVWLCRHCYWSCKGQTRLEAETQSLRAVVQRICCEL